MSSAAVAIMASEPPGGGQPKKLHPLFAPPKAGQTGGDGAADADGGFNEAPELAFPQQGLPQHNFQQPVFQQQPLELPGDRVDPPMLVDDHTGPPPIPIDTPQTGARPAAGPPVPVQVNAFEKLKTKRKPDDPPIDGPSDSSLPAPEPKRRGRPPKKRKSSPPPSGIANLFPRQPHDTPTPVISGLDNGETSGSGSTNDSTLLGTASPITTTSTPAVDAMDGTPTASGRSRSTEPPKRMLQINPKTGTIGSPPKPQEAWPSGSAKSKRKAASPSSVPRPLVVPYPAQDPASRLRIGNLIDTTLHGSYRSFAFEPTKSKKGPKTSKSTNPMSNQPSTTPSTTLKSTESTSKNPHPFFTVGRPKGSAANVGSSSTPTASKSSTGGSSMNYYTSTPCSPKRPRGAQMSSGPKMPQFGAKNGILRVPGACVAAWPWKGVAHVRPEGNATAMHAAVTGPPANLPPLRKRKGNAITIRNDESILKQKIQSLNISSVIQDIRDANADAFAPAPPELHLPQKRIESGQKLQARIAPQLRTSDPGLQSLFASITTTLPAFDQHECESSSWAQKYAPSCAIEVLQSGPEPLMLKAWLEALKVVAVDTGPGESGESGTGKTAAAPRGKTKRRRKKNKLDGFIVSSDDEDDDMGEASDNEADWSASGQFGLLKNTVVRTGNLLDKAGRAGARLTNAVVISGPHGCGKSAAVYAVAKELGFEVFEISASSRRSGKDVIDRIGDMTRNHLVQHKKKKLPKQAAPIDTDGHVDEDDTDIEDAEGDPDLDFPAPVVATTSKQPTMSSFFKPQGPTAANGGKGRQTDQATTTDTTTSSKGIPHSQKQSLILLEEADILYEEDKHFWTTVMSLVAQSKRPFVITCNDETLIPLQNLPLHAIFRFTPPPTDVAVDRLIMIAACEGHALQRKAVQSLYEVRDGDFRASLVDLQFWCQIGVGDRRGGFDWFYQRWPDGIDLDEDQHVKRVVSKDTYQEGMGWLNYDTATSSSGTSARRPGDVEDDLVQQAWNDWQLDMGQWQDSVGLVSWAGRLKPPFWRPEKDDRRRLLKDYDGFASAMSDADLVSAMVFATGNRIPFDATQPELSHKAREDYIINQQLLDRTIVAHENDDLRLPMATAMRCAAKRILQVETNLVAQTLSIKSGEAIPPGIGDHLDYLEETRVMTSIRKEHAEPQGLVPGDKPVVNRIDFSLAFDPIAVPSTAQHNSGYYASYGAFALTSTPSSHLEPSVFNRTLAPIVVDVAPFVRYIVAYEGRLQKQRQKLSSFLTDASSSSAAGSTMSAAAAGTATTSDSDATGAEVAAITRRRPVKRMRTTRTALSALEGGQRSAVRKERWFYNTDMNPVLVMRTGGDGWDSVVEAAMAQAAQETAAATETKATAKVEVAPVAASMTAAAITQAMIDRIDSIPPMPRTDSTEVVMEEQRPSQEPIPGPVHSRQDDLIVSSLGIPANGSGSNTGEAGQEASEQASGAGGATES